MDTSAKTLAQLAEEGKEKKYITLETASKISGYTREYLEHLCRINEIEHRIWNNGSVVVELESLLQKTHAILLSYEGINLVDKSELTDPTPQLVATLLSSVLRDVDAKGIVRSREQLRISEAQTFTKGITQNIPRFGDGATVSKDPQPVAFVGSVFVSGSSQAVNQSEDLSAQREINGENQTVHPTPPAPPQVIQEEQSRTITRIPISLIGKKDEVDDVKTPDLIRPIPSKEDKQEEIATPKILDKKEQSGDIKSGTENNLFKSILSPQKNILVNEKKEDDILFTPPEGQRVIVFDPSTESRVSGQPEVIHHIVPLSISKSLTNENSDVVLPEVDKRMSEEDTLPNNVSTEKNTISMVGGVPGTLLQNPILPKLDLPQRGVLIENQEQVQVGNREVSTQNISTPLVREPLAIMPISDHHPILHEKHPLIKNTLFNSSFGLLFVATSTFFISGTLLVVDDVVPSNFLAGVGSASFVDTQYPDVSIVQTRNIQEPENLLPFSNTISVVHDEKAQVIRVTPVFPDGMGKTYEYALVPITSVSTTTLAE